MPRPFTAEVVGSTQTSWPTSFQGASQPLDCKLVLQPESAALTHWQISVVIDGKGPRLIPNSDGRLILVSNSPPTGESTALISYVWEAKFGAFEGPVERQRT